MTKENGTATGTAVAPARNTAAIITTVESRITDLAKLNPSLPSDRFLATFKMAVNREPKLLKCTQASVLDAIGKACADGLMLDGREAALQVRYGKTGKKGDNGKDIYGDVAVYVPMFQGLMKRARNSGEIASFQGAFIVYENEVSINEDGSPSHPSPITGGMRFVFERGDNERIFHDPILFGDPGEPVGCYSIVRLRDGSLSREFMSWKQILAVRDRNVQTKKNDKGESYTTGLNPVWKTDLDEMAKKTVIRRHTKKLPLSSDLAQIFANMDDADGPDFEQDGQQEANAAPADPRATKKGGAAAERLKERQRQAQAEAAGANRETGEIEDAEIVSDDPGPDASGGDGPGEDDPDGSYF